MRRRTKDRSEPVVPTRTALIRILKAEGPTAAETLAERLGLTPMAVRQHLYQLQESGVVSFDLQTRPVGRPAKLWKLMEGSERFFADRHGELSVSLLEAAENTFGREGIERLLETRAERQSESYHRRVAPGASLSGKLKALAKLRSAEGYMAETRVAPDGSLRLIENHCPICVAARACRGLCENELQVFREVLGREVEVERVEHILTGDRRCVYRVARRNPGSDEPVLSRSFKGE